METISYTGNWYLKKRFFGGFDICVEIEYQYHDNGYIHRLQKRFRKASKKDLINFKFIINE